MYPYFIMFHLIHAHLLFSKLFLNKLHSPLFLFLELRVKGSRHVNKSFAALKSMIILYKNMIHARIVKGKCETRYSLLSQDINGREKERKLN